MSAPLFKPFDFGAAQRQHLDHDGHLLLPGVLTDDACTSLTTALRNIQALMPGSEDHPPNHFSAEFDTYLASLIRHPQMLALAHAILGDTIRFDHCVALTRPAGNDGASWHSHAYAEDDSALGFVRIFLYVNGFAPGDGNLKVVPGSHLFRDPDIRAADDAALQRDWLGTRRHPHTGEPLAIESLAAPPATVALMWTHAAHGVNPKRARGDTRWSVVYAYKNPGAESKARWITPAFERALAGSDSLMSLY